MTACTRHPDAGAGWRCERCPADLCPRCAGSREAGRGRIEVCLACGSLAHVIRARRAVLQPFGPRSLAAAVRWPFSREGFVSALACAAVIWLLGKGGVMGGIVAEGLAVAFFFRVTASTARGHDDFRGAEDFHGFFEDVLGPLFRALLASVWAWGPFIAWVVLREGGFWANGDFLQPRALTGTVPILLLFAGTLLFPMALLAGALSAPFLQLLNPLVIVGYAIRLGRDYWLLSGFCLGLSIAESLLLGVLGFIDDRVLGLPGVLQVTALLYPPLVLFRALGLLVRARGDELGYGGESSYLEPVLGDAQPEVQLRPADHDALLAPDPGGSSELRGSSEPGSSEPGGWSEPAAIAEPVETAPAQVPETRERELELAPEPGALPAPLDLARKLLAGDPEGAAAIFERSSAEVSPATLSAQAWIGLARGCLQRGRGPLALIALERAVAVAPEGPLAPQALLQAARICDEHLDDRAHSDELLAELVERHPGSTEARFAARRLRAG